MDQEQNDVKHSEVNKEVKAFRQDSLKKTVTVVKNTRPTQDDINAEKAANKDGE